MFLIVVTLFNRSTIAHVSSKLHRRTCLHRSDSHCWDHEGSPSGHAPTTTRNMACRHRNKDGSKKGRGRIDEDAPKNKVAWDRHYANAAHASSQVSTSYPSIVQIILCKPCPSQSYILPGLPSNTKPAIAKLLHLFAFPTSSGEERKTKKAPGFLWTSNAVPASLLVDHPLKSSRSMPPHYGVIVVSDT